MDLVHEVKERLSIFKNLYDNIRIIDPINKVIHLVEDNIVKEIPGTCYEQWKKNKSCENCISMRAYLNNDTFVKMEYDEGRIILITASPIEIDERIYIVEILKDITENGISLHKLNGSSYFAEELLSEMNEKVIRDGLTGLYNRRYINDRLAVDMNYMYSSKQPLSIIMGDIDYFKNINDKYGHVAGDKILVDFSKIIDKSIRNSTDWVGRYGGEEFLIVLNNTNLNDAYVVAEKIRKVIERTVFQYGDFNINITASFGIFCLDGTKMDLNTFIEKVDNKLYNAKVGGRNRSCK